MSGERLILDSKGNVPTPFEVEVGERNARMQETIADKQFVEPVRLTVSAAKHFLYAGLASIPVGLGVVKLLGFNSVAAAATMGAVGAVVSALGGISLFRMRP